METKLFSPELPKVGNSTPPSHSGANGDKDDTVSIMEGRPTQMLKRVAL